MREISLNILDIAQNSVAAGASLIHISIEESAAAQTLRFTIVDNGCGMDEQKVNQVLDPFFTSRTTRKVGLGIPLLKLACEETGGGIEIGSKPGIGTKISALFHTSHIDCMPLGDIVGTVTTLIFGSPDIDFVFTHTLDDRTVTLDTREARGILGAEVPLNTPDVIAFFQDYLREQYQNQQ